MHLLTQPPLLDSTHPKVDTRYSTATHQPKTRCAPGADVCTCATNAAGLQTGSSRVCSALQLCSNCFKRKISNVDRMKKITPWLCADKHNWWCLVLHEARW